MTRFNELEEESSFKNNLGRENRGATIRRSIVMLVMAIGAIAAAVLLAPPAKPTQTSLDASGWSASTAVPAASLEPAEPADGSLPPRYILPGERIESGYQ
jgi:hypothetical protein